MPLAGRPLEAPTQIPRLLHTGLARAPGDMALVSTTTCCTWRDLNRASDNLAGNLLDVGLQPGDRVASLMPNCAALIIHYIACMKAGLVGVPLNYRYTTPEIDHALEVSEASILLADAGRERELARSRRVPELRRSLILHEAGNRGLSLQELMSTPPVKKELPVPNASNPAFIFFTSGSTGPAKGVTHSYEAIGWMFASMAMAMELTTGDVMLPASSISHLAGFILSLGTLAVGARVIVAQSFDSQTILKLLRKERPTILSMQPTMLFGLVADQGARYDDFSSLRLCRCGSDKVPAELVRKFNKLTGMVINEGYGMTEVGFIALNPPSGVTKIGSVGLAMPGLRLSIRDEGGQEVPAGTEGRLWISAPSLTMGYWKDPAGTAAIMHDGWLDSGDVMTADGEGYLAFCGRKKQLIVHDGSNISPQEVEDALLEHAAVAIAGVVGVRDPIHGENVRAYVTFRPGAQRPTVEELIQFARARVGYKAPEKVEFLAEMPLNAGKVDRAALKRLAAGDGADKPVRCG
jgi:acyl-CoA synthetase (AMP-forming)/AMP-acid ligase II